MTYHSGTFAEFDTWEDAAKDSAGIPAEGKIGYISGELAPNSQRTTAYSAKVVHPTTADYCIWVYGDYPDEAKTNMSLVDVQAVGFLPPEVMV